MFSRQVWGRLPGACGVIRVADPASVLPARTQYCCLPMAAVVSWASGPVGRHWSSSGFSSGTPPLPNVVPRLSHLSVQVEMATLVAFSSCCKKAADPRR